jgi:hypothetical protein
MEFYERHWARDIDDMPVCRQCSQPNHKPSVSEIYRLAAYEGNRLAGRNVYFWGFGSAYAAYGAFFGQCRPRFILYDGEIPSPDSIEGIPVRHPDEVLLKGEKLPIIVFAYPRHSKKIVAKIYQKYPHYTEKDIVLCHADLQG